MIKRIFNLKNFVRATSFGVLTFILYKVVDLTFGDKTDLPSSFIGASIMFFINFMIGVENLTWREVFFGRRKNKN